MDAIRNTRFNIEQKLRRAKGSGGLIEHAVPKNSRQKGLHSSTGADQAYKKISSGQYSLSDLFKDGTLVSLRNTDPNLLVEAVEKGHKANPKVITLGGLLKVHASTQRYRTDESHRDTVLERMYQAEAQEPGFRDSAGIPDHMDNDYDRYLVVRENRKKSPDGVFRLICSGVNPLKLNHQHLNTLKEQNRLAEAVEAGHRANPNTITLENVLRYKRISPKFTTEQAYRQATLDQAFTAISEGKIPDLELLSALLWGSLQEEGDRLLTALEARHSSNPVAENKLHLMCEGLRDTERYRNRPELAGKLIQLAQETIESGEVPLAQIPAALRDQLRLADTLPETIEAGHRANPQNITLIDLLNARVASPRYSGHRRSNKAFIKETDQLAAAAILSGDQNPGDIHHVIMDHLLNWTENKGLFEDVIKHKVDPSSKGIKWVDVLRTMALSAQYASDPSYRELVLGKLAAAMHVDGSIFIEGRFPDKVHEDYEDYHRRRSRPL